MGRARDMVLSAGLAVVTLAVALVALETALRMSGFADTGITDPVFRSSDDPGVVYEFRRSAEGRVWGHTHMRTNAFGLRGPEIAERKDPGTLRVGVFGDSVTFGQGVEDDTTYARVLEGLLRESVKEAGIEVLNFGVPAYNISNIVSTFVEKGTRLDLDVAVLAPIVEDYGFHRDHHADAYGYPVQAGTPIQPGPLKNLLRNIRLAYLARDAWLRVRGYGMAEQGVLYDPLADPALAARTVERAEQEITRFARVARERGIVPVYAGLGFGTSEAINRIVDREGLAAVHVQPALKGYDTAALVVSARDNHPSALQHRVIAGEMLKILGPILRARAIR